MLNGNVESLFFLFTQLIKVSLFLVFMQLIFFSEEKMPVFVIHQNQKTSYTNIMETLTISPSTPLQPIIRHIDLCQPVNGRIYIAKSDHMQTFSSFPITRVKYSEHFWCPNKHTCLRNSMSS